MRRLKVGCHGTDVYHLQQAINARARARGLPTVTVDGQFGPMTDKAVQRMARALGASEATIRRSGATVGEQRIIRWPATRTPAQLARARSRAKATETARTTGPGAALREAKRHIGRSETTDLPLILGWIHDCLGIRYRVAWCGVFVWHCLRAAGVPVTGRMASVAFVLADALAGRNGMKECVYRRSTGHGNVKAGRPGDVAGLYGENVHEGLVVKRVLGGYLTREGNTSSASQSNGRAVEEKFRPDSAIAYLARPAY